MDAMYGKLNGLKQIFADCASMVWGFIGSGFGFLPELLKFGDKDFEVASGLWQYIGVIAVGIAIIMFLVDLDKVVFMMQGNFSYMKLFEPFVKFVVAMVIISNGGTIISWIIGFNNWFIKTTETLSVTGTADAFSSADYSEMNPLVVSMAMSMDIWTALISCLAMFVVFIIALVPTAVMAYNAVVRKLEFVLRVGFAPIAFADVYKGMDSTAIRYIKKLLALVLYGGGMILILKIGAGFCQEVLEATIGFMPSVVDGMIPTTSTTSWIGQIFGTIGTSLIVGSGISTIIQVLCMVVGLLGAIVILFAELGACSMIKQACNEVLGV